MDFLKKIFFSYQRLAWYVNQAKSEYAKFGSFIPETLMIITYLSVKGIEVEAWHIPFFYIILMIIAGLIGKIIAVVGITKYNNSLSNNHNEEIMEIRNDVKLIKERLGIK